MDPPSRNRCRQQTRQHQRRVRRTTRDASAQSSAGAGERGPAPRGRVSVTGESAVKRLYPLVRELAADGIPVAVSCRVLKLSRQPYYRWLAAPVPDSRSSLRHIGPMRSSMPTAMIPSSGTDTSPTKPKRPANPWRHALRGGCVRPMTGSPPSARAGPRTGRSRAHRSTTICARLSMPTDGPGTSLELMDRISCG